MPSLGADMEAGTVLEWRVGPGSAVHRGDIVAVIDTDKADVDVEIFEDGVVDELLVPVGRRVAVGTPLARVTGVDATTQPPSPTPGFVRASPLARRLAAETGHALGSVAGTGPGGAVVAHDLASSPADRAHELPPPVPTPATRTRSADSGAMQRAVGALMARSKQTVPHYYLARTIDLHAALDQLKARNEQLPVTERILPAAMLLRATAVAAAAHSSMNGFWNDGFEPASAVHLGVAVSLRSGGLVAPAILDADQRSLPELMAALQDLVQRARAGRLRASEMSAPTLTVTNLGDQGADEVFGVIYPPQVALVGFGRVVEEPRVVDGSLVVRPVVRATLSGDHRASNGHDGSRFLATIDRLLQHPEDL